MKMTSEKIFQTWKGFRKDLNNAILFQDLIDVDYEFELDTEFFEEDVNKLLNVVTKMHKDIATIKESMK